MRRHPRALGERERPESFKRPGHSALRVHSNSLSLNLAMPPAHPRQSAGIRMHRAKTPAPWRRRARCARGQPPGLRLAAAAAANAGAAAVLPVSFARAGSCRVQPSMSHSRGGGAGGGQSQDHPQGPRPEARRLCLPHAHLAVSKFCRVSHRAGSLQRRSRFCHLLAERSIWMLLSAKPTSRPASRPPVHATHDVRPQSDVPRHD